MRLLFILFLLLNGCSSNPTQTGVRKVVIEVDPYVETYYPEIVLESCRRITFELGLSDENGKFKVKMTF